MPSKRELQSLDRLCERGRFEEACMNAMTLLDRDGASDELFAILDRCAEHSSELAYGAALSYIRFERPDPGSAKTMSLLRRVVAEDNPSTRGGHYYLAQILLRSESTEAEGIAHLEEAADLDHGEAQAEMGEHCYFGGHGLVKDKEAALEWLSLAIESGSVSGHVSMAKHILETGDTEAGYNPFELLRCAAAHDSKEAAMILRAVDPDSDPEQHEPMLPYVVIPADMSRPSKVMVAMMEEFGMPDHVAGPIVAALFGFPDWPLFAAAVHDEGRKRGKFDEDCSEEELTERVRLQTSVLLNFLDMPQAVAEIMVGLLRPTAKKGPCSLRKLEEATAHLASPLPFGMPPEVMAGLMEAVQEYIRRHGLDR